MPTDPTHPPTAPSPAPCPWCGGAAYRANDPDEDAAPFTVRCIECDMSGPYKISEELAIAAWNRVALAPAALKRLVEAAQDVVCTEMSDSWCREFVAAIAAAREIVGK